MTEKSLIPDVPQDSLQLKLRELDILSEQPWHDDKLSRKQTAERLTKLIRNQRESIIISINGQWGTGKTYLLKRWQKDLEKDQFRAIYYNAWEDDFCNDPLLSIIGQMSEQFKEGKFKKSAEQVGQIAVQLIRQNLIAVPSKLTGLDLSVDLSKLDGRDLIQEYSDQRKTKDLLKNKLTQLSVAVAEETGRPLVFIIDELDRCRPTFAIELLERVKHIFDVPGLVFVFGLNRAELCKSLQSVYGEIDADLYLNRFFDIGFSLPDANAVLFCISLMDRYKLEEHFLSLDESANYRGHSAEYRRLSQGFPSLCVRLNLSLREIDHCVRLIALIATTLLEKQTMYPDLLAFLIPLKLKEPSLYRQFILGERRASEVLNYVDGLSTSLASDRQLDGWLHVTEAYLYAAEGPIPDVDGGSSAIEQLELKAQDQDLTRPDLLSTKTQSAEKRRAKWLLSQIQSDDAVWSTARWGNGRSRLDDLAGLIDFQKTFNM